MLQMQKGQKRMDKKCRPEYGLENANDYQPETSGMLKVVNGRPNQAKSIYRVTTTPIHARAL